MEINDKVFLFNTYDEVINKGIIIEENIYPFKDSKNPCFKVKFIKYKNFQHDVLIYMKPKLGTKKYLNVGNSSIYIRKAKNFIEYLSLSLKVKFRITKIIMNKYISNFTHQ